jgi:glutaredoxin 3
MMEPQVVELYGAASCPFTAEVRAQLEYEGRRYVEYDAESDSAARARLVSLTGETLVPALIESGRVIAVGWHGRGCRV